MQKPLFGVPRKQSRAARKVAERFCKYEGTVVVDKKGRKASGVLKKGPLLHRRRKLGRKVEDLKWKISESGVLALKMRPREC